jgi:hypothetical protein
LAPVLYPFRGRGVREADGEGVGTINWSSGWLNLPGPKAAVSCFYR